VFRFSVTTSPGYRWYKTTESAVDVGMAWRVMTLSLKVVLVEFMVVVVPVTFKLPEMVVEEALMERVLLADPRVIVPVLESLPRRRDVFPWMVVVVGAWTVTVPEA
jgi:hypothetical protein